MRFQSVGLALSVGMALIVVLLGFTLLSAAGLVGFAANDGAVVNASTVTAAADSAAVPADTVAAAGPVLPAAASAEIAAGDALFKGNCAQCHAVNEIVVGPALSDLTKRRSLAWILPWVKNSSKVVASGDEYAVALYTKFQKQQMPSFALSDREIMAIVTYLTSQEDQRPASDDSGMAMIEE